MERTEEEVLLSLVEPVLAPAVRKIISERNRYRDALEIIRDDDNVITFEECMDVTTKALGYTPVLHEDLVQLF